MEMTAVIAAGGKGSRMGADINKVFLKLGGKEILARTTEAFEKNPLVREIIVVTGKNDIEKCKDLISEYGFSKVVCVVEGGSTRRESVANGLQYAKCGFVAVHDAARALITEDIINDTASAAEKYGAAAPGVLCKDTVKIADNGGFIESTPDRSQMYMIQTPQIFKTELLKKAHNAPSDAEATDDCMLVENMGGRVKITEGSYENIKLTTPDDMLIGEMILKRRCKECE